MQEALMNGLTQPHRWDGEWGGSLSRHMQSWEDQVSLAQNDVKPDVQHI
jgi:hypothetical protein